MPFLFAPHRNFLILLLLTLQDATDAERRLFLFTGNSLPSSFVACESRGVL